jgi:hypothetical protein
MQPFDYTVAPTVSTNTNDVADSYMNTEQSTPAPAMDVFEDENQNTTIEDENQNTTIEDSNVDLGSLGEMNDDKCNSAINLAEFKTKRNMEELMLGCQREKSMNKYTNASDDMVLLSGAEWSVPQERPPICYQPTCVTSPMMDQTALIGTLLGEANETQVGSILPKFSYKEATDL